MNIMAKRLYDEYTLTEFYRVFNKLWHASSGERSLAIHTLQLYQNDFDLTTWHFIRGRLEGVKSLDEVMWMGEIIGAMYTKDPSIKRGILQLSDQKNQWMRRVAFFCFYNLFKRKEIKEVSLFLRIIEKNITDNDETMQKKMGSMLCEIGKIKKDALKRFILNHKTMSDVLFLEATSGMQYLRKIKTLKKLNNPISRR